MRKKNRMIIIIFLIILESLVFKLTSTNEIYYNITLILLIANTLFIGYFLLQDKQDYEKKINIVILFSYILRVIILFLDIYTNFNIFSGLDTEQFYAGAIGNRNYDFSYTKFLKFIFLFIGNTRIVAEYVNVIASILTLIIIKKILYLLEVNNKTKLLLVTIIALAPINILLSGCLLRESIMIFINSLSLYFFIKWYKQSQINYFIKAVLLIFLSAWFHSGMIVAVLGYGIAFIIYNHKKNRIIIYKNTIISFFFVLTLLLFLYNIFGNYVTMYFSNINSVEDIGNVSIFAHGTSDYLTFLNNKSAAITILSLPLKIIYFFASPMLWNCRNIKMLMLFLFSSTIYLYLLLKIIFYKATDSNLKKLLIIVILLIGSVYSLGTSNTGTAMRHREKILPFLIIASSLCMKEKKDGKEE